MKKVYKNLVNILIIVLLLIIIFLKSCNGKGEESGIKIVRDTIWVKKDSTIISKPELVKTIPYTVEVNHWNTEYLPDTSSMAILVKQYETLVRELLAKNIHKDSIKIDSIGHVYITDTVCKNEITGRSTHYDLHYPVITNTITLPAPKTRQLYWGFGIGGHQQDMMDNIKIGLLYKNKQDFIFGPNVSIEPSGAISYGVDIYFKIKLRK